MAGCGATVALAALVLALAGGAAAQCPPGEFQTGGQCQPCPPNTFKSGTGIEACAAVTVCAAGNFPSTMPTSSSDAVCTACGTGQVAPVTGLPGCVSCRSGEFQNEEGELTCKTCPTTEFQNEEGEAACKACQTGFFSANQMSEQPCAAGSECGGSCATQLCSTGRFQDEEGEVACKSCALATFQNELGQTGCKACPPLTFQNNRGRAGCKSCTAGRRSTADQTAQVDCVGGEACLNCVLTVCGPGEFSFGTRNTACTPCSPGEFQSGTGQTSCDACPAGSFQNEGGEAACKPCNTNTEFQDEDGMLACKPLTPCPASQEPDPAQVLDGTFDQMCREYNACSEAGACSGGGDCVDIVGGPRGSDGRECRTNFSVAIEINDLDCLDFEAPERAQFASAVGTLTGAIQASLSNARCRNLTAPCPRDTFATLDISNLDNIQEQVCTAITTCPAGEFETATFTATSDRVCNTCPAGTFKMAAGNAPACPQTTADCSPGQFVTAFPTPSTDRQCATCPPGTLDDDSIANTQSCTACGPGTFLAGGQSNPAGGQSNPAGCSAFSCVAGTVDNDNSAATPCAACPPGYQVTTTGNMANTPSADLTVACSQFICPAGTIDNDRDPATGCVSCPAGAFAPAGSAPTTPGDQTAACAEFECAVGTTDDDRDARTPCVLCAVATVVGSSGPCPNTTTTTRPMRRRRREDGNATTTTTTTTTTITLIPCTNGQERLVTNMCQDCAAGTVDHDLDPATACEACPAGTSPPAGSFASTTGLTVSQACRTFSCPSGSLNTDAASPCVSCTNSGIFVPAGSSGACSDAGFVCPSGTTDHDAAASPGSSATTPCEPCPAAGRFVPAGSALPCADSSFECAAGTIDADSSSDSPCVPCGADTFQTMRAQTTCNQVTPPCNGTTTFESLAPSPTNDRVCSPVTVCNDELEREGTAPTVSSDRVCVSLLNNSHVFAELDLVSIITLQGEVTTALENVVANGTLLAHLQMLSPAYEEAVIFLSPPSAGLFDNPDNGTAFVTMRLRFVNLNGVLGPAEEEALRQTVRILLAVPIDAVVLIPLDASAPADEVAFRLEVPSEDAETTATNLNGRVRSAAFLARLRSMSAVFNGPITNVVIVESARITQHIDCVPCVAAAPGLYSPRECEGDSLGECAACTLCPFGQFAEAACAGQNDTTCTDLPAFQHVAPVSIEVSGLGFPTSVPAQETAANTYDRHFEFFFDKVVGSQGTITAQLGQFSPLQQTFTSAAIDPVTAGELTAGGPTFFADPRAPVLIATDPADSINADSELYYDDPVVQVGLQLRDINLNTRTKARNVCALVDGIPSSRRCVSSAGPSDATGFTPIGVTVPASEFQATQQFRKVCCGVDITSCNDLAARDTKVVLRPMPAITFADTVLVTLPATTLYPGDEFQVRVQVRATEFTRQYALTMTPGAGLAFKDTTSTTNDGFELATNALYQFAGSRTLSGEASITGVLSNPANAVGANVLIDLFTITMVVAGTTQPGPKTMTTTITTLKGINAIGTVPRQAMFYDRALRAAGTAGQVMVAANTAGQQPIMWLNTGEGVFTDLRTLAQPAPTIRLNVMARLLNNPGVPVLSDCGAFPGLTSSVAVFLTGTGTPISGPNCDFVPDAIRTTLSVAFFDFSGSGANPRVGLSIFRPTSLRVEAKPTLFPIVAKVSNLTESPVLRLDTGSASCVPLFTGSSVRITAVMAGPNAKMSTRLDVTRLAGQVVSDDPAVVAVDGTASVLGVVPGSAQLSFANAPGVSAPIVVSGSPLLLSGIDIQPVREASLGQDFTLSLNGSIPLALQSVSRARVVAKIKPFTLEDQTDGVVASGVLFDAASSSHTERFELTKASGLTLSALDSLVTVDNTPAVPTITAATKGTAALEAVWQPAGCPASAGVTQRFDVTLNLPSATGAVLNLGASTRLSAPGGALAAAVAQDTNIGKQFPAARAVTVMLQYPGGQTLERTLDPRTVYDTAMSNGVFTLTQTAGAVTITGVQPGEGKLVVRFTHEAVTAELTVQVFERSAMALTVLSFPQFGGQDTANSITTLRRIGTLPDFQQAELVATMDVSAGATTVPRLDISAIAAFQVAMQGSLNPQRVLTVTGTGTSRVSFSFEGQSQTQDVTVDAGRTPLTAITGVAISRTSGANRAQADGTALRGISGLATFQLTMSATFGDGTVLDRTALFGSASSTSLLGQYAPLFNFTASDPSVARVDMATGRVTLVGSWYEPVSWTLSAEGGSVSNSVSRRCNLLPGNLDVDLGLSGSNAPVGPLNPGATFSLDVRVRSSEPFEGLSATLGFDSSSFVFMGGSPASGAFSSAAVEANELSLGVVLLAVTSFQTSANNADVVLARLNFMVRPTATRNRVSFLTGTYTIAAFRGQTSVNVRLNQPIVAGRIPLFVSAARRRRDPYVIADAEPAALPDHLLARGRRMGNCVAGQAGNHPQGDANFDCLFTVADSVFTQKYVGEKKVAFNTLGLGPILSMLSLEQLALIDADNSAPAGAGEAALQDAIALDDVSFINKVLGGRIAFVTRPVAVPVREALSNCQLRVSVDVTTGLGGPAPGASPTGGTRIFFALSSPNAANNKATFQGQFDTTFTGTGLQGFASMYAGGFVEATTSGDGVFSVDVDSTIMEPGVTVGVTVMQAVLSVSGQTVNDLSTAFLAGADASGSSLPQFVETIAIPSAEGESLTISRLPGIVPLATFTAQELTSACRTARRPRNPSLQAVASDARSLTVVWQAPSGPLAAFPVTGYTVSFRRVAAQPTADPTVANAEMFTDIDVGNLLQTTVPRLEEFITYQVGIRPYNTPGDGIYQQVLIEGATAQAAPSAAPTAVQVAGVTATEATMTWGAIPPPDQNGIVGTYQVEARPVGPPEFIGFNLTESFAVFGMTHTFTNLESHVIYAFRVAGITSDAFSSVDGQGPFSVPLQARTLEGHPDEAPLNTAAVAVDATTIMATWQPPRTFNQDGVLDGFSLQQALNDQTVRGGFAFAPTAAQTQFANVSAAFSATALTHQATGLIPGATYKFRVAAFNRVNGVELRSPFSNDFTATALEAMPTGMPTIGAAVGQTSETLMVTVQLPPFLERRGLLTEVTLFYRRVTAAPRTEGAFACEGGDAMVQAGTPPAMYCKRSYPRSSPTVAPDSEALVIPNLEKFIEYEIRASVSTQIGEGPVGPAMRGTTAEDAPDGAVLNLVATPVAAERVQLEFDPPLEARRNGIVTRYVVTFQPTGDLTLIGANFRAARQQVFEVDNVARHPDMRSMVEVTGLLSNTAYQFNVSSATGAAPPGLVDGAVVETVTAQTPLFTPDGRPNNVVVQGGGPGSNNLDPQMIRVTFEASAPPAAHYAILHRISDPRIVGPQTEVAMIVAAPGSYIIPNLRPFVRYDVQVSAEDGASGANSTAGPRSSVQNLQTASARPSERPALLSVAQATRAAPLLDVRFNEPSPLNQNGALVTYRATWTRVGGQPQRSPRFADGGTVVFGSAVSQNQIPTSVLQPFTNYAATVALVNTQGTGPSSISLVARTHHTAPDGPPTNIQRIAATQRTLTVRCRLPEISLRNGPIQGLLVTYSGTPYTYTTVGGGTATRTPNTSTLVETVTLSPSSAIRSDVTTDISLDGSGLNVLEPYIEYSVVLQARTSSTLFPASGASLSPYGPRSTPVLYRTAPGAPNAPPVPEVDQQTVRGSTVTLSWPELDTEFGPITFIQVVVEPAGSTAPGGPGTDPPSFGRWEDNLALPAGAQQQAYITTSMALRAGQSTQRTFVVGDGAPGADFTNGPLNPSTAYTFRLRVFTGPDATDVALSATGLSTAFVSTAESDEGTGGSGGGLDPTVAGVIGALVAIILVLLLLMAVRAMRRRRKQRSRVERLPMAEAATTPTYANPLAAANAGRSATETAFGGSARGSCTTAGPAHYEYMAGSNGGPGAAYESVPPAAYDYLQLDGLGPPTTPHGNGSTAAGANAAHPYEYLGLQEGLGGVGGDGPTATEDPYGFSVTSSRSGSVDATALAQSGGTVAEGPYEMPVVSGVPTLTWDADAYSTSTYS